MVIDCQLLALEDLARGEQANLVQALRLYVARKIEACNIWFTRVVDEPGLVPVKHAVDAEREELTVVAVLDALFESVFLFRVVHVEEVAEAHTIVVAASHVSLLFTDDLATVLYHKSASRNVLACEECPHL